MNGLTYSDDYTPEDARDEERVYRAGHTKARWRNALIDSATELFSVSEPDAAEKIVTATPTELRTLASEVTTLLLGFGLSDVERAVLTEQLLDRVRAWRKSHARLLEESMRSGELQDLAVFVDGLDDRDIGLWLARKDAEADEP